MSVLDINIDEFKKLFDIARDVANVGYWEWDIKTNEVFWSKEKIDIYGEDRDEFEPSFEKFLAVIDEETKKKVLQEIDDVLSLKKDYYDLRHKIQLKTGKEVWVHEKAFLTFSKEKEPLKLIGIVYNITNEVLVLKRLKENLKHASYLENYDKLTNLRNRDSLHKLLDDYQEKSQDFWFIFLDIDNFKTINNIYGHLFGDLLLEKFSTILKEIFEDKSIYRYSSDEFVVIDLDDDINFKIIEFQNRLSSYIELDSKKLKVSACIGIARYPDNAKDTQECIKNAACALNLAKKSGRNKVLYYDSFMSNEILQKQILGENIQFAIDNDEFIPYFQPKVDSSRDVIVGFESLIRWNHDGEILPPGVFLDVAIENKLIGKLDVIMLEKSLQQLKEWHDSGLKTKVSVNFTDSDLQSSKILDIFQNYSQYLPYLVVEITETELLNLNMTNISRLKYMKNLGIKISLDDFGTGYSSLQYLHELPIDELKIDKSFIDLIPGNKKEEQLVKIIHSIVETFELDCVVEGVENIKQIEFLNNIGLDIIQGYFYYKPMDAIAATELLQTKG